MTRQQLLEQIDKTLSFTHLTLIRSVCVGDIAPCDAAKNVLTLVPVGEWEAIAAIPFDTLIQDSIARRHSQLRKGLSCPRELVRDVLRDPAAH